MAAAAGPPLLLAHLLAAAQGAAAQASCCNKQHVSAVAEVAHPLPWLRTAHCPSSPPPPNRPAGCSCCCSSCLEALAAAGRRTRWWSSPATSAQGSARPPWTSCARVRAWLGLPACAGREVPAVHATPGANKALLSPLPVALPPTTCCTKHMCKCATHCGVRLRARSRRRGTRWKRLWLPGSSLAVSRLCSGGELASMAAANDDRTHTCSHLGLHAGRAKVLVASDAMTRGMDVDNVQNVVNYDAPVYAKTYVHRCVHGCGRALDLLL